MTEEQTNEQEQAIAIRDGYLVELAKLVGTAESLTITNDDEYEAAAELLQNLKGAMNRAEESRKALGDPHRKIVEIINSEFRPVKERYEHGESVLKKAIGTFRRKREEDARKAEAAAREKADKERRQAEERARKAEEKGQTHKAEQYREQAESVSTPIVAPSTPKVSGVHTRKVQKWEYVDQSAITAAYMVPDEKAIAAAVRSMGKRAEGVVGGIRVWEEDEVVSRGRSS